MLSACALAARRYARVRGLCSASPQSPGRLFVEVVRETVRATANVVRRHLDMEPLQSDALPVVPRWRLVYYATVAGMWPTVPVVALQLTEYIASPAMLVFAASFATNRYLAVLMSNARVHERADFRWRRTFAALTACQTTLWPAVAYGGLLPSVVQVPLVCVSVGSYLVARRMLSAWPDRAHALMSDVCTRHVFFIPGAMRHFYEHDEDVTRRRRAAKRVGCV